MTSLRLIVIISRTVNKKYKAKRMQTLSRNRLIGGIVLAFAAMLFVPAVLTPKNNGTVSTPDLSIKVHSDNPLAKSNTTQSTVANQTPTTAKENHTTPGTPTLQLESFDDAVATNTARTVQPNTTTATITRPEDLVQSPQSTQSNTSTAVASAKNASARALPIKLESFGDDKPSNKPSNRVSTATTTAVSTTESPKTNNLTNNTAKQREQWIRVGSFSDLSNADNLAAMLKRKRYSVKIENVTVSGQPYRRVLLGPFTDNKKMQKVLKQISAEGFSPSIQ